MFFIVPRISMKEVVEKNKLIYPIRTKFSLFASELLLDLLPPLASHDPPAVLFFLNLARGAMVRFPRARGLSRRAIFGLLPEKWFLASQ